MILSYDNSILTTYYFHRRERDALVGDRSVARVPPLGQSGDVPSDTTQIDNYPLGRANALHSMCADRELIFIILQYSHLAAANAFTTCHRWKPPSWRSLVRRVTSTLLSRARPTREACRMEDR